MLLNYDALEDAGHDFTHCGMMWAGTHLYYCENCGSIIVNAQDDYIFHAPKGSKSGEGRCAPIPGQAQQVIYTTLKDKLEKAQAKDWERLKEI